MKKFFVLFAMLCATSMLALAQNATAPTTLEGWAARLQKFGKSVPQEQVFIHMDNTCYFLGDTLFYKAYVRRSDSGAPSQLSGLLYVELLNQDGYLVERQFLELKNGEGDGSFCLLDTLYGGYYELRAYTRWQLNWGATTHPHTKFAEKWFFNKQMAKQYYRDYEKLYSRVFPVFDKPKEPGDFVHDMTLRPLRRHFKADNAPEEAVLSFFPEGGHLVAGATNRVAFEANNDEGRHLEGTLTLTDATGATVAEAKTEQRGRGVLEFEPKATTKYTAQFVWEKGSQKAEFPTAELDGCPMQVKQEGGQVKISLFPRGVVAQQSLGLTVMSQGLVQDFKELGTGESLSATLNAADLRTGVIQLSVFDAEGRIYADRLIFVKEGMEKSVKTLTFSGCKDTYEPFAPIEVAVEGGEPGSKVSLSLRDASHTEYTYDNGNILTEMLLSSQIRGFVENPGYYFEKDDEEHQRALDLLLMVQGWRRFNWYNMATPGAFMLNFMPEQTQMMSGEVNNYTSENKANEFADKNEAAMEQFNETAEEKEAKKADKTSRQAAASSVNGDEDDESNKIADLSSEMKDRMDAADKAFPKGGRATMAEVSERFNKKETGLKREVLMHAEFTKPGAEEGVFGDVMTEKGFFNIESPKFYEQCYFFLGASDSTKWSDEEKADPLKHNWVVKGEDMTKNYDVNFPEYYVKLNPIYPRFVKPYVWYQQNLAEAPKGSAISPEWQNDGSRTLSEITVGARRNGMSRFDASKPAYVIDAYQAFNDACDAGLCTGTFTGSAGFAYNIARTYIGDMNIERAYEVTTRFDSRNGSANISNGERDKYNKLTFLHKVYVYTDYSPRREGDKHFEASNQPTVDVDLRLITEAGGTRDVRRDRRYVLQGYAVPDLFYNPDYTNAPAPETKDYRRTLYWNPNLELDASGKAQVKCFNNCKKTQLSISAEGMTATGLPQTGNSMPEDRK